MQTRQINWLWILMAGVMLEASGACLSQEPAAQTDAKDAKNGSAAKSAGKKQAEGKTKSAAGADDKAKKADAADQKEKPKDAAGDKKDDAKDKTDDADKEVKEKLPFVLVEPGYSDWRVSGAQHKFRQYATPPRGFFLKDFRLSPIFTPGAEDILLDVKSPGQSDYAAEGRLGLWYGNTMFRGLITRNRFFDPTPALIDPSERRVDRGSIRQALGRNFALSFNYRLDEQHQFFEPPRDPQLQETRYRDLFAGGKLGNGYLSLKFSDWSFLDRTGELPTTTTRSLGLGYLWEVSSGIGLEGNYTRSWIEQSQQAMGRLDTLSLDGDFAIGPATTLDILLRQRHIDTPQVQNAFVRDQRYGSFQLAHRWHGWSAQAGLKVQEAERVRGDHTFVDVPRWRTVEGKLTGRLNHQLRMTLRGSTQTMDHAPVMITEDTRSLYWTGRDTLQFKLDGSLPNFNGYLEYAYRHWRNSFRSTTLTTHAITAGGDWQISQPIDVYVEYSHEFWSGRGENRDFPSLGNYTPDSRVVSLGLNWTPSDRLYFSVNYTDFTTFNDNPLLLRDGNTNGNFVTLNGHYRFPRGYELGLTIAPWTYRDRVVNTQDYDATVFMVTGTARF